MALPTFVFGISLVDGRDFETVKEGEMGIFLFFDLNSTSLDSRCTVLSLQ